MTSVLAAITGFAHRLGEAKRWTVAVFAVGSLFQLGVMLVFSEHVLESVRGDELPGTPGSIGITIAILAALAGGPLVGASVATVGWAAFALLVYPPAEYELWSTVVALPIWVAIAGVVGFVSDRLVALIQERERAHGRRTPFATMAGIAEIVRTTDDPALRDRLLRILEQTARDELARTDAERSQAG